MKILKTALQGLQCSIKARYANYNAVTRNVLRKVDGWFRISVAASKPELIGSNPSMFFFVIFSANGNEKTKI